MTSAPVLLSKVDSTPDRIAESARAGVGRPDWRSSFLGWFHRFADRSYTRVTPVGLNELDGWTRDPDTGNIAHESGRFYSIEGLEVDFPAGPVRHWSQPIIIQPETGILGILVKEFDGVWHLLMQAKVEPGNCNGLQLSPTVQATRSNYSRVHRGRSVPYLEYFLHSDQHRIIADARQSEQGSWFDGKRNRNMIVEVTEDVDVLDGFRWMTLGQVHQMLGTDDVVNMDARTVLSCLPFAGADLDAYRAAPDQADASWRAAPRNRFRGALVRSFSDEEGSLHRTEDVLSWITEARSQADVHTRRIPLAAVKDWRYARGRIIHNTRLYFDVMGVRVEARGREVSRWSQPMIRPAATGVIGFLVKDFGGVLHVLVHARMQPGFVDVVELAPTVQCIPGSHDHLPVRPRFLDELLTAGRERIRFDTMLSEEGGRFYHARNRYLIVEARADEYPEPPGFRWLAVHQLTDLLRHSHYLNVEARSLVACLHSLAAR